MQNRYDINNPMAPLWIMYPYISRYSIGWRMGAGEEYAYEFINWFNSLSEVEQRKYKELYPEPIGWLGWYEKEHTDNDVYEEGFLVWKKAEDLSYSLEIILSKLSESDKFDYIFFWGHQPSKNGTITKSCFSQWWKSQFRIDHNKYCCMEQYMMAEKARLFNDKVVLKEIMDSTDPKEIKALGRKVRNFDEGIWNSRKYSIVLRGSYQKFVQDDRLKEFLLSTKKKILVEASPFDNIWGVGMSINDTDISNPLLWRGENLLGFALMEIRDEINRVYRNSDRFDLNELHSKFD